MGRLKRFEGHRYVGTRLDMLVYDCDNDAHFEELRGRVDAEEMVRRDLLQTFGPDTLPEARNRGFTPR
jgi:hypothetical protein